MVFSRSVSTFFLDRRNIVHVGAYKNHFAICYGYDLEDYLKQKYPDCKCRKATIQFPYDKIVAFNVLADICERIAKAANEPGKCEAITVFYIIIHLK